MTLSSKSHLTLSSEKLSKQMAMMVQKSIWSRLHITHHDLIGLLKGLMGTTVSLAMVPMMSKLGHVRQTYSWLAKGKLYSKMAKL